MKEYTPTHLRESNKPVLRDQVLFAIGDEHEPNSFGMWHGVNPKVKNMLEIEGHDNTSCIIRFNKDSTSEVLYRWNDNHWVKQK